MKCYNFLLRCFLAFVFVVSTTFVVRTEWKYRRTRDAAPKGVLLLTQMRSGSSFAGHLLTAASSTFYTEEPVREFLGAPPSTSQELSTALQLLKDILRCRFSSRPDYYARRTSGMHNHNAPTTNLCDFSWSFCNNPRTEDALCLASHVRLARVVALDLDAVRPLISSHDLNIHVLHLVRDPRGVLSSRGKLSEYGYFQGDALSAKVLCDRYRRNIKGAAFVRRNFPQRYTLLRYEDLSIHTVREIRRLYSILGLSYTPQVAFKISYHTLGMAEDNSYSYGTTRNSTATVFGWRDRLSFAEVEEIQDACKDVLVTYGYRVFHSEKEFKDRDLGLLVS